LHISVIVARRLQHQLLQFMTRQVMRTGARHQNAILIQQLNSQLIKARIGVDNPYNSSIEQPMSREELRAYLLENDLLNEGE
jgi:hypothetical protein